MPSMGQEMSENKIWGLVLQSYIFQRVARRGHTCRFVI